MELDQFKLLVGNNPGYYLGSAPESIAAVKAAEEKLGCQLPRSMIWLLCEHGYSDACGVSSLDDCVTDTLRCRAAISLPFGMVILNDWGDAGVVLLDARTLDSAGECTVIWTDTGAVHALSKTGEFCRDAKVFSGFAEWSKYRLGELIDERVQRTGQIGRSAERH
jgi:hypothetical protein